jgi:hypothetical protein
MTLKNIRIDLAQKLIIKMREQKLGHSRIKLVVGFLKSLYIGNYEGCSKSYLLSKTSDIFAANYCMEGGDLYAVSKILNHASAEFTATKYAHLHPSF